MGDLLDDFLWLNIYVLVLAVLYLVARAIIRAVRKQTVDTDPQRSKVWKRRDRLAYVGLGFSLVVCLFFFVCNCIRFYPEVWLDAKIEYRQADKEIVSSNLTVCYTEKNGFSLYDRNTHKFIRRYIKWVIPHFPEYKMITVYDYPYVSIVDINTGWTTIECDCFLCRNTDVFVNGFLLEKLECCDALGIGIMGAIARIVVYTIPLFDDYGS